MKVKLLICTGLSGNGVIAPLILGIGTGWKQVTSFMARSLFPRGTSTQHPPNRKLVHVAQKEGAVCGEQHRVLEGLHSEHMVDNQFG